MSVVEKLLTERRTKSDFPRNPSAPTCDSPTVTLVNLEKKIVHNLPWAIQQVQPLLELDDNWDGYQAAKPNIDYVRAAALVLSGLRAMFSVPEPFISPTPAGGVSMEWESGCHYFEIELESTDRFSYLYKDTPKHKPRTGRVVSGEPVDQQFVLALKQLF